MNKFISNNFIKKNKKGFTLVEMVVTLAVLSILLAVTATNLVAWTDYADFKRENEYAETMFFAAQNQLAEYSANGTLEEFADRAYSADLNNKVDITGIYYEKGKNLSDLTQDEFKAKFGSAETDTSKAVWTSQSVGTLCYAVANKGDFELYKAGKATTSKTAFIVFELLEPYVYDSGLLNQTIGLEFSLEDGQVFSAFYTDKSDESGKSSFVYDNTNENKRGKVNIATRYESYREDRMIGYYGVDTLSMSLRTSKKKPKITNISLNDEDTLNLSYKIGNFPSATNELTYEYGVYDNDTGNQVLKIVYDTQKVNGTKTNKLKVQDYRTTVTCEVTRFVYDESGNLTSTDELGDFDFIAYLDSKNQVRFVLDAVDIQATTARYQKDLTNLDDATKVKNGEVLFADTYSFHRFGIDSDNIYCTVMAYSSRYRASTVKESNVENAYFASEDFKKENDSKLGGEVAEYKYSIENMRHLYNARYVEDISNSKLNQVSKKYSGYVDVHFYFDLNNDIDWKKFVNAGNYYNSGINNIVGIDNEYMKKAYFASINKLKLGDTFDGNDYTITGLHIAENHNYASGLYAADSENRPVGLFNTNYGIIKDLELDNIQVKSSRDKVGSFCGVNVCSSIDGNESGGLLSNLWVLNSGINTDDASFVTGREHVGGIVGYLKGIAGADDTDSSTQVYSISLKNLNNAAKVSGKKYVGGILGEVRNTKNAPVQIVIEKCNNAGAVLASNSTIDANGNISNKTNIDPEEGRYIGGITGYCANMYEADNGDKNQELITIKECLSNPVYSDSELESLLNDDIDNAANVLKSKLNGVYVGGIVGYNYWSTIELCNTVAAGSKQGYVFGYKYVGGIVGFNQGPTSGIIGGDTSKSGINEANVVGNEYVGGITGCNADLDETAILKAAKDANYKDSNNKDYAKAIDVLENTSIVVVPVNTRNIDIKIQNWKNKGIVFATGKYAGGISGYNTGWIYGCNTEIDSTGVDDFFQSTYSTGDYAGGIAGYNNGVIGNTAREDDAKLTITDTRTEDDKKISAVCYISGKNYVGGIVGYNDENAIVEDYEVSGGYILGDTSNSYYVGGYVGFNSSLNLLTKDDGTARALVSKANDIKGQYFVGGCIGGNIINTNGMVANASTDEDDDGYKKKTGCYLKFVPNKNGNKLNIYEESPGKFRTYFHIEIHNETGEDIKNWYLNIDADINATSNVTYDKDEKKLYSNAGTWNQVITKKSINTNIGTGMLYMPSEQATEDFYAAEYPIYILEEDQVTPATGKVTVSVSKSNSWNSDGNKVTAQYEITIHNGTDKDINNWKIEIDNTYNATKVNEWNTTSNNTSEKITFYPANHNVKVSAGGNVSFGIQYKFANNSDASKFSKCPLSLYADGGAEPLYTNVNNGSSGSGGTVNANKNINTQFLTDNFLGTLTGKAFVGGYIGYNLFIDNSNTGYEQGYVYALQSQIIKGINTNSGNLKAQYTSLSGVIDNNNGLSDKTDKSDFTFIIEGKTGSTKTNSLGNITADICVGGVLGYNDEQTNVVIKNVRNTTPIVAKSAISCDEQNGRDKDYAGRDKNDYTYSYAGGIIGKVSSNTTIDSCSNSTSGTVSTQGTYHGGLCEINEGVITNCTVQTFGSSVIEYVGGLCGLNKQSGNINNCVIMNASLYGKNVVGGVASENFGTISKINIAVCKVAASGATKVSIEDASGYVVDGAVGGIAAYNAGEILVESDIVSRVSSNGNYAGAVVGVNSGKITNAKITDVIADNASITDVESNIITITGSVTGKQFVGGLVGKNNSNDSIRCYKNKANITAVQGIAGGISGENASGTDISYCINEGVVSAINSNNAGGITSINDGTINKCYDYEPVLAPAGMSGGIVATNKSGGKISDCYVQPKNDSEKLAFSSFAVAGGIAAENEGLIENVHVKNVTVSDYTTSNGSLIGVIAGRNAGTIAFAAGNDSIVDSKAMTYTDSSNVGGVVGLNEGRIKGADLDAVSKLPTTIINVNVEFSPTQGQNASFGGVAGKNLGTIERLSVDGNVIGNLSSELTGYGGIAGVNGYCTKFDYNNRTISSNAVITDCTFDGKVAAQGAGAAVARIGGITGINGYGGDISHSYIGVLVSDSVTKIYAGKQENADGTMTTDTTKSALGGSYKVNYITKAYDTQSYAYIGGIAGNNFGTVHECDNHSKSVDNVKIYAFSSIMGGIVGYCEDGKVTGSSKEHLSTGENWEIIARSSDNDRGNGGIIGTYSCIEDIAYADNYADVQCLYQTNPSVGGLIGFLDQNKVSSITISNCVNYGEIKSYTRAGGMIALLAFGGVTFNDCINYGNVVSVGDSKAGAAGFIQYVMRYTSNIEFNNCENHGEMAFSTKKGAGFVTEQTTSSDNAAFYFNNCVNTGIMKNVKGNEPVYASSEAYGFAGFGANFNNCRNYGNGGYYSLSSGTANARNCLSVIEDQRTVMANPISKVGTSNNYYINKTNKNNVNVNYGVAAVISSNSVLRSGSTLYDPLMHTTGKIQHMSDNKNYADLMLDMYYEDGSQGADGLVIYLRGDNNAKFTYDYTLYDASGNVLGSATGLTYTTTNKFANDILKIDFGANKGKNVAKVRMKYVYNKADGTLDYCKFYGFGYMPTANPTVYEDFNNGYDYLADTTKTSFNLTTSKNLMVVDKSIYSYYKQIYFADYSLSGSADQKDNYYSRMTFDAKNGYVNFTFDISYADSSASGVDKLYVYLSTADGKNSTTTTTSVDSKSNNLLNYNYYVEYIDENNNHYQDNDASNPIKLNNVGYCHEVVLDTPSSATARIKQINFYVKVDDTTTKKTLKKNAPIAGFKWSAIGDSSSTRRLLGYIDTNYKQVIKNGLDAIELCEESVSGGYAYTPIYNGIVLGDSIMLTQQVQNANYYNDYSRYDSDYDVNNTGWTKGSRVGVYKELDDKYEAFLASQYDVDSVLAKPTGLKCTNANNKYKFEWTANQNAYTYRAYYELLDEDKNVVYTSEPVNVATAAINNPYIYLDSVKMDTEFAENGGTGRYYIKPYVEAVSFYSVLHQGEADENSKNSGFATMTEVYSVERLPIPEVHFELLDGNTAIAVLDNKEDYTTAMIENIKSVRVYSGTKFANYDNTESTEVNINPITGVSQPFKFVNVNVGGTYTVKANAETLDATKYLTSMTYIASGSLISSAEIESTKYVYKANFNGLYGSNPEAMSYHVALVAKTIDVYASADIVAKDTKLGVEVAYASGNVHTASMLGGAEANFEINLSGLPSDMIGKDFEVRSYLYASQSYMQKFGHEVVTVDASSLSSYADLTSIVDDKYVNSAGAYAPQSIVDGGKLRDGYVIYDNQDGTYTIYYTAAIELDNKNGVKAGYQVHRVQYKYNVKDESSNGYDYYTVTDPANTVTYTNVLIQPKPVIENSYIMGKTAENKDTYTFEWDKGLNSAQYANATYNLELFGTTLAGEKVSLKTVEGLTSNSYTFVDEQDNWNYNKLTIEVTRVGTVKSVATNQADILPNTSSKEYKRSIRLSMIATPDVSLAMDGNTFDKNNMIYTVTFSSLTDNYELSDLGGYLLKVKVKDPVPGITPTATHYYYVKDINNASALTDELKLDLSALSSEGVVINLDDDNTSSYDSSYGEGQKQAKIDLSDYVSGEIVEITVQAIARNGAVDFTNGYECDSPYELEIPVRLSVPSISNVSAEYDSTLLENINATKQEIKVDDLNEKGITLKINDSTYSATDSGNYDIAIAIYDEAGKAEQDANDIAVAGSTKKCAITGDAPGSSSLGYWNSGAIRTLNSKKASTKMTGSSLNEASYGLLFPTGVKLSDYAGQWMKIAIRAESNNAISSYWSDEDPDGNSTNYYWVQIPVATLNEAGLTEDTTNPMETVSERYLGNNNWSTADETDYAFAISNRVLNIYPQDNADGYELNILGKDGSLNELKLIEKFDDNKVFEGYEVYGYYISSDDTNIIGNQYKYYGLLDSANSVTLDYKQTINITGISGAPSDASLRTGTFIARLEMTDDVIKLLLPDFINVTTTDTVIPSSGNVFTEKVTLQSIVNEDKSDRYISSVIGGYYRDEYDEECTKKIDQSSEISDLTSTLTYTPGTKVVVDAVNNTGYYPIELESQSQMVYHVMIIKNESGTDVVEKEFYGMTRYVAVNSYKSSFTLDSVYLDESVYKVIIDGCTLEPSKAISKWSKAYYINTTGYGACTE